MPTLAMFYGISILMYYDDHGPAHFHARYAEHKTKIELESLNVIGAGKLPRRQLRLVREWADEHADELDAAWEACQVPTRPTPIAPLP